MKRILIALVFVSVILAAGCSKEESGTVAAADSAEQADVVSSASVVDTVDAFMAAAGRDGSWIIAITRDLESEREILLEGEFVRREEIYRKLALYAQDEDRTVTARYTLKAPRLVVKSENTRIQGGTFEGDVYVQADKFHIYDATVDGDIIFATEGYKSSFSLQEGGEVTGTLTVE